MLLGIEVSLLGIEVEKILCLLLPISYPVELQFLELKKQTCITHSTMEFEFIALSSTEEADG